MIDIRKAFAWLVQHGFAEKYNPYHYPAGHPKAGQFAPKDWAEGEGKDTAKHIPRRGESFDLFKNVGKRLKPADLTPKERTHDATESNKPWTKEGDSYKFKYESFKTKEDAIGWLKDKISNQITGDKGLSLDKMNAALSHLRIMQEHAPLKKKLAEFSFQGANRAHLGTHWDHVRTTDRTYGEKIGLKKASLTDNMDGHAGGLRANIALHEKYIETAKVNLKRWEDQHEQAREAGRTANYLYERNRQERYIDKMESNRHRLVSELKEIQTGGEVKLGKNNAHALYDNPMAGVVMHEYGHAWHKQNADKVYTELQIGKRQHLDKTLNDRLACSDYARTNSSECFAEGFTAYMAGATKQMGEKMTRFFDKEFPSLNFGGTHEKKRKD